MHQKVFCNIFIFYYKIKPNFLPPEEYQPKLRGWLLGTIDGTTQGIMPANYMKILGKKLGENSKTDAENKTSTK